MTLSVKPFSNHSFLKGVFISEVEIVDAEDISGEVLPHLQQPFDIGVRLKLEIGRSFQPEFVIAGNFKRDELSGEVIGWGSAFVVQEALSRLGFKGDLEPDNRIPEGVVPSLVGKRFLRLSYVSGLKENGKLRYNDWNMIATLEEGAESLLKRFERSLSRGYPRNYRPELMDANSVGDRADALEEVF